MDLEQYNTNLRELAERTGERLSDRVIVVAATKLLATMSNRVFRDGLDSEGKPIGQYSTTPIYVPKEKFIQKGAFKAIGKNGKDTTRIKYSDVATRKAKSKLVKKDYSDRTTMYLKEGYKEFREIQGRPTSEVNLQMKGDLKLSFTLQNGDNETLIGFDSELQSKKRKGLEKHFKKEENTIFPATAEEKEIYAQEVVSELNLVTRELLENI